MDMILLPLVLAAGVQATPGAVLIDRQRADRAPPATATAPAGAPVAAMAAGAPDIAIAGIRFTGARAPAPVAEAARRFIGRRATRQTLTELAAALSSAYGRSAVALYTVAIPAQDFARGVVIVDLTEGRIVRAQLKRARPGRNRLLRARLARMVGDTALPRATYERQIVLIRDIPGLTPTIELTDPHADGALVMTVTPRQRRTRFSAGFSNRGIDLLGAGQFDLTAIAYGLGVDGDQLSLSASAASDLDRYRYASAAYTAPLGADGLTASISAAYLRTRPPRYPLEGRARQVAAALAYPLVRSFHRSADVSLGIDGLNSDNAAFGNLIATERTRAVRLSGSLSDARERRSFSIAGSASHGLDVAGARVTAPFADATFTKITAAASVDQTIGQRLIARLSASGQYSRDALPAAERFAIGGPAIGRAFDAGLLTGDRGVGGLVELAWRPVQAARLATSELYGFVDGGRVGAAARGPIVAQRYGLASAGAGFRLRHRDKAELGLEAAHAIDKPYPTYREDWRALVEWRLTL
ncbi:ShlB/FhaC/HecB family hemolysin secretion/activation protein [Sphingomonas sp.]|uniref:ShlB/FhaC/HecB family hemolysin secretion/activation protein n=1 Tax=Sphingomonas sp. TaxID=28214 RepID=UPI003CC529CF